jgi:4-carboxymuconolactone decarboxylase
MIPPPDFVGPAFQHSSLSKAEIEIATNLTNALWLAGYSNYEHEIIGERDGGLPPEKVEALIAGLPTSFEDPRQQVVYQITSALITLRLEIGEGLDDVVVVLDDGGRIDIQSKTTANLSQSQTSPLGRSYGS